MAKFQVFGTDKKEESAREIRHKAIARRVAAEGIVLLKNEGVLPMTAQKIALYGPGSRMTVKGGSGSGDVRERHSVTIEEGLLNAGFSFPSTLWMDRFSEKYKADVDEWHADVERKIKGFGPIRTMKMFDIIHENPMPYPSCTPILPDELTNESDTAIYVLSRQAGEGRDRRVEKGDYLLSDTEVESLKLLSSQYKKLILVLNCGGTIDLSILDETRVDAVLFFGRGGMEGGNAFADNITGTVTPSGRLTDTWAFRYEDYPGAETFSYQNGDLENENYTEGIYVGYRWFDKQGICPRFPFGFGLSYTTFETVVTAISETDVSVCVTNTGWYSGREAVLIYLAKPEGEVDHEKKSLVAFAKTKCLIPNESQTLNIHLNLENIASFDEKRNLFFLEKGEYTLLLDDREEGHFTLPEERLFPLKKSEYDEKRSEKVSALLTTLTVKEKIRLVTGGGYALKAFNNVMGAAGRTCTKLLKKGVPNIVLADGPAGLNVNQSVVIMKDGSPRYPDGLPEDWKWGWLKNMEPFVKAKPGKGTIAAY